MNYLILLNRKFPYKSGEAFLENEIDEIAGGFDKIFIYPSDVCAADKLTRNIKSLNVEARVLEQETVKKRQFKYLLKGIKFISVSKERSIIKKILDAYFMAAADSQKVKILSDLKRIEFKQDDKIYIYSYWLYINAKVACLLKKYFQEHNVKCVAFSRAHRFDIYEEKRKFSFLPQRKTLLYELNHVYACSDDGTNYLKEHYSAYADKISTAYLGTYDHGIGKSDLQTKFRIVSCSRLSDVKRVYLIIEALKELKDSGIQLEWTHLGGGDLYDDIKKKAADLDWMEVHLDGAIANTEVYEHYHNVREDLFINVSSSEGLPVSIMEAISFGIPVVATDVGGTSEIVIDKISGTLLNVDFEPKELADCIKQYATMDMAEYEKLRKSTRKLWEKYYQAPANYNKFVKSIKELE